MNPHTFRNHLFTSLLSICLIGLSYASETFDNSRTTSIFLVRKETIKTLLLEPNSLAAEQTDSENLFISGILAETQWALIEKGKREVVFFFDLSQIPFLAADFKWAANAIRPLFASRSVARWDDEQSIREFLNAAVSRTSFFKRIHTRLHEMGIECSMRYGGEHPTLKPGVEAKWDEITDFSSAITQPENRHYYLSCHIPVKLVTCPDSLVFNYLNSKHSMEVLRFHENPFASKIAAFFGTESPDELLEFCHEIGGRQFGVNVPQDDPFSRLVYVKDSVRSDTNITAEIWEGMNPGSTFSTITAISKNGEWASGISYSDELKSSRTWLWNAGKCRCVEMLHPLVRTWRIQFCSGDGSILAGLASLFEEIEVPFIADKSGVFLLDSVATESETITCLEIVDMSDDGSQFLVNGFCNRLGKIGLELKRKGD